MYAIGKDKHVDGQIENIKILVPKEDYHLLNTCHRLLRWDVIDAAELTLTQTSKAPATETK